MKKAHSKIQKSLNVFKSLIKKGGPEKSDYDLLNATINELGHKLKNREIIKEDLIELYSLFDDEFINNTMQGHALRKPYGYSGDFMIIDMTYQFYTDDKYHLWDKYTHNQVAVQAVRNRKDYFIETMIKECEKRKNVKLLNLASGPARDLLEFYELLKTPNVLTHCIEYDTKAIAYSKKITSRFSNYIEFENANLYNYEPRQKYDIIWSAGLFDYFDDKTFIKILKRILNWTNDGFEIIIGNLKNNPSRYFLEVLGDWHLHYRNEEDLIRLAEKAGVQKDKIEIKKEKSDVNLFLHIK